MKINHIGTICIIALLSGCATQNAENQKIIATQQQLQIMQQQLRTMQEQQIKQQEINSMKEQQIKQLQIQNEQALRNNKAVNESSLSFGDVVGATYGIVELINLFVE